MSCHPQTQGGGSWMLQEQDTRGATVGSDKGTQGNRSQWGKTGKESLGRQGWKKEEEAGVGMGAASLDLRPVCIQQCIKKQGRYGGGGRMPLQVCWGPSVVFHMACWLFCPAFSWPRLRLVHVRQALCRAPVRVQMFCLPKVITQQEMNTDTHTHGVEGDKSDGWKDQIQQDPGGQSSWVGLRESEGFANRGAVGMGRVRTSRQGMDRPGEGGASLVRMCLNSDWRQGGCWRRS